MTGQPRERDERPFRAPPALYVGPLLVGAVIHLFFPLRFLSGTASLGTGVSFIVLGVALWVWAVGVMLRAGTSPEPRHPATTVVTRGPFRYSRNPIYVAYALAYAGISCLVGSTWMLVLLPVALVLAQRLSIASEERYLEQRFGESYLAYKAKVRRWV